MKKSKMSLFRIYTEDKNYNDVILPLMTTSFDGFTVFRGEGYWKGQAEKSLLLEVYTSNKKLIKSIAERIKEHNKQESVLVTETKCKIEFI